jgi:hypothetical protein
MTSTVTEATQLVFARGNEILLANTTTAIAVVLLIALLTIRELGLAYETDRSRRIASAAATFIVPVGLAVGLNFAIRLFNLLRGPTGG